tara:strand:- start:970 stop:1104 length:135 start_codon:yes stop_codon:yes gene_type:complete
MNEEEIKKQYRQFYEGFCEVMKYFNELPEESRAKLHKKLNEIGL